MAKFGGFGGSAGKAAGKAISSAMGSAAGSVAGPAVEKAASSVVSSINSGKKVDVESIVKDALKDFDVKEAVKDMAIEAIKDRLPEPLSTVADIAGDIDPEMLAKTTGIDIDSLKSQVPSPLDGFIKGGK